MTPNRANIEPIARSMPPVMMTKPSPIENSPNRPIRFAVLPRLMGDRKRGFRMETTRPTTTISRKRPRSFFSTSQPPLPAGRADRRVDGGRPDIERGAALGRVAALDASADKQVPGEGGEVGERDVLVDRRFEHQSGALAILGDEEDAVVDRIARRADGDRPAVEAHFPADRPLDAEEGAGELGAAGADQARHAEDLARE